MAGVMVVVVALVVAVAVDAALVADAVEVAAVEAAGRTMVLPRALLRLATSRMHARARLL